MGYYPKPIEELIQRLERLPGIGPRSAERIVNYLLDQRDEDVVLFAESVRALKDQVRLCRRCFNLAEDSLCAVCMDAGRRNTVCVVEEVKDLIVIEKTGYRGLYHVLGGRISTLDHIGPDRLRIPQLMARLEESPVEEVIIATNPNPEGEDTALYLSSMLKRLGVKHSRLAYGLPVGAEIEYVDAQTLKKSIDGRREW